MSIGHNSTNEALLSIINRVERLEDDKGMLTQDIKEVMSEAKSQGFDTKIIRKVLRIRKMDAEKRREEEELIETYLAALGMLD